LDKQETFWLQQRADAPFYFANDLFALSHQQPSIAALL
jgi:hypothetical protein